MGEPWTYGRTCPSCHSSTSANREAFGRGEPCPNCGLPAAVAEQVFAVRESAANDEARQAAEHALIRAGQSEARGRLLAWRLDQVAQAFTSEPPEYWQPDPGGGAVMRFRAPADRLRFLARQLTPDGDTPPDPLIIQGVANGLRTIAAEADGKPA